MKKVIRLTVILFFFLTAWLILRISVPILKHNGVAEYWMETLRAQRQQSARRVDQYSKIGLFVGDGNHCDILCIVFWKIDHDYSKEESMKFFEFMGTDVIFHDEKEKIDDFVKEFSLNNIRNKFYSDGYSYFIYIWTSSSSNGDIRCW